MIKRLFIANRGEIVRRIALSARALGIETVAIACGTPPAFLAGLLDHFVTIPDANAALYNDGAAMIRLAREALCDAIHPGFGFLAENAAFAAMVDASGLTLVGPSAGAIDAMGNKVHARERAQSCQVPVIPGLNFPQAESMPSLCQKIEAFALEHGFPLIIKSATGGGGRGMRRLSSPADIDGKALAAIPEIRRAMAEGGLLVEKYIERGRHIEVQIVADRHGATIALGDRECSVQRRFQKVVEEAPSCINEAMRSAMHAAAVRLAKGAGYFSVGTVEFLVDALSQDPLTPAAFYFLEMNTRLQVEHTVTEQVFGIDLVALQLKIAAGERLSAELKAGLVPRGASIQARIYAEKVAEGFLPAPGMVHSFAPYQAPFMRWEIGIDPIDEIATDFDPMVGKAIATGATRHEAIGRLAFALKRTVYTGTASNIPLLIALLEHPEFLHEAIDTHFLTRNLAGLVDTIKAQTSELMASSSELFNDARLFGEHHPIGQQPATETSQATRRIFAKRPPASPHKTDSCKLVICSERSLRSPRYPHITSRIGRGLIDLDGHGRMDDLWFVETAVNGTPPKRTISINGVTVTRESDQRERRGTTIHKEHTAAKAMAPLPGRVVCISVAAGDQVLKNDVLLTIESMKMEFAVRAPYDLTVGQISVSPGAMVRADETLVVW